MNAISRWTIRLRPLLLLSVALAVVVAGIIFAPRLEIHTQKMLSLTLKYVGMFWSAVLSWYSLRRDTTIKSGDPLKPNIFTPAGERYLIYLAISTVLTVGSAIWENYTDSKLNDLAKK